MFTKIKNLFKSLFKAEEPINETVATVEVPPVIIEAQKPAPKKQQAKKPQTKKPQNRSKKAK